MNNEATYGITPHANTRITVANPSPEQQRLCKVDDRERERERERERGMKDQHANSRDTQTSTIKRLRRDPVRPEQNNLPVKGNFVFLARWVAYEFKHNHCHSYSFVRNPN